MTTTVHSIVGHTHATSDVTGLDAALGAKSATGHTHAASDITSGTIATARLPIIVKTIAATQSIDTTTTLTNITGMVFVIAANEEWVYELDLLVGGSLGNYGLQLDVTVPALASYQLRASLFSEDASTPAVVVTGFADTPTVAIDFSTGNSPPTSGRAKVSLRVLNGANAGNVQFQYAQSNSDASSLDVKAGSYGIGFKK
jgi:hypothetical protein